jgi:LacI family transcriptional regulator
MGPVSETGIRVLILLTFWAVEMNKSKRPTIADVARVAGVSKSTVSRVLNDRTHHMRQGTRQRVLQAMDELGYRPSAVARSLVSKRTHTVGLLISDVGNPFYPEVIHGVEDVALAAGYDVFLCNTSYDLERGMAFVRSLADKQVDGTMLMSSSMSDELVLELARHQIPVVVLDWQLGSVDGMVGTIAVDFRTGIRAAANHLVDLGHRHIAHVSGPAALRTACNRRDFFLDALADRGIDRATVTVVEGNFRIDGGRQAMAALAALTERPTAVFAGNDLMALGIVWEARKRGLDVPQDLSVVGLDDILLAQQNVPPLTTVALPRYDIGSIAMQMLLDLIPVAQESQSIPIYRETVSTHLSVRQSTAPPGA